MLFVRQNIDSMSAHLSTLGIVNIEHFQQYKYFGIWLDQDLSLRSHILNMSKKLKPKIAFLFRSKYCISLSSRKKIVPATILLVLGYGDRLYTHVPVSDLKQLDTIYHSTLQFVTGASFQTHHYNLYCSVGWFSFLFFLFFNKVLIGKFLLYLTNLLSVNSLGHTARPQEWFILRTLRYRTEEENIVFK